MKRSDFWLRLAAFFVFIALVIYIGYAIIDARSDPFTTAEIIKYSIDDFAGTTGYIVRSEVRLPGSENCVVTAEESAHLSTGDAYAMRYLSRNAMARAEELSEIERRLDQIEAMLSGESSASAKSSIEQLARVAAIGGTGSELESAALDIRTYIFGNLSTQTKEELMEQQKSLQAQRDQLKAAASTDTTALTVPSAGTFSAVTDDMESFNRERLNALTPGNFNTFFEPGSYNTAAVGKLITDITWYYATVMDEAAAARLAVGKNATLRFTRSYDRTLTMKVDSIGAPSGGKCVVIFSSTRYLEELTTQRALSADVLFSAVTGYRVPRDAVHVDEKGTYIYVLRGLQSHLVYVDILGEMNGYYVVSNVDEGELSAGLTVIVRGKGLYDGKVVS